MMEEYQDQILTRKECSRKSAGRYSVSGVYKDHEELREVTIGEEAGGKQNTGKRGT